MCIDPDTGMRMCACPEIKSEVTLGRFPKLSKCKSSGLLNGNENSVVARNKLGKVGFLAMAWHTAAMERLEGNAGQSQLSLL